MSNDAELAGVIFDCDGTLADTMPLHFRAWKQTLDPYGVDFSEQLFYELGGVPSTDIVRILNDRHTLNLDAQAIAGRKEEIYIQILPEAQPIEAVVSLVRDYADRYPLAVASGGIRPLVTRTLEALGILVYFQVVATAEDVERGKPHPDLFLFAARGLGVPPAKCLVYEDSPLGLEAARRAGMRAVDVRDMLSPSAPE
ncbi:MAG: beta-phosphoglucomutase family hydrolase [Chloroflexi bacterium]|nr:beta-phosphoglucomutase family hydrolase [Chloroflexota bacterium]